MANVCLTNSTILMNCKTSRSVDDEKMTVYWTEIYYKPQDGLEGAVYAFVKSKDAVTAYIAFSKALMKRDLIAVHWKFIVPYCERWEDKRLDDYYRTLSEQATEEDVCIFDDLREDALQKVYCAFVECVFLDKAEAARGKGCFVNIFVKSKDAIEAYRRINDALLEELLKPILWISITPVEKDAEWENEEDTARLRGLWHEAANNDYCVFDDLYSYQND